MTTLEVANKLVELCKQGKNDVVKDTLYANDIVSVEAGGPPGQDPVSKGKAAVAAKGKWWADNHTIHSAQIDGPYPNGDQFIVKFTYDVTFCQPATPGTNVWLKVSVTLSLVRL